MSTLPIPAIIDNGATADSSRPVIVFLHGIGGGKQQWSRELEALGAAGWRAIAWDMPGYGDSAMPSCDYTFDMLANSLLALLDDHGIERALAVGHSMGGMVALETYAKDSGRFAGLVLACTSAAFGMRDGTWQQQFLSERLAPLDEGQGMGVMARRQVANMMPPDRPDDAANDARERAIAVMSAVPESTYRSALKALITFDRRDALSKIDVPTLVLAAPQDSVAPPVMMQRMAARIHGAEFAVLADCGHLANFERPEAFLDAIVEFAERRCCADANG